MALSLTILILTMVTFMEPLVPANVGLRVGPKVGPVAARAAQEILSTLPPGISLSSPRHTPDSDYMLWILIDRLPDHDKVRCWTVEVTVEENFDNRTYTVFTSGIIRSHAKEPSPELYMPYVRGWFRWLEERYAEQWQVEGEKSV